MPQSIGISYYSLAIDENTDATDTAQLLVFVRGIDDNFDASEELAGRPMQSMQGRTTGKDICSAIRDCVTKKLSSDFKKLVGLFTVGAPAMCGKTEPRLCHRLTLKERLSLTTISKFYAARF